MPNPFFYGNPVPADQFVGRRRELRRIANRIVSQGQSTAVVGEPRIGKTSLLLYLSAPETRAQLYGPDAAKLLFSDLDAQTFGGQFDQAQFWEYVLRPLQEKPAAAGADSALAQAYETCRENSFGAFVLERLLVQAGAVGWRLVLLLDEFGALLHHPVLNSAEFFGSLRSLASRSRGALVLVIASRTSLASLNTATQQFSRLSSPYFNFLTEVTLGPWTDREVAELLRRAGDRFTAQDHRFVVEVAGGHPYLVQVAAYELWESYVEGEAEPGQRWQQVGYRLYDEAARTLGDIWQIWPPATRKAFTAVALAHIPSVLGQREFHAQRLHDDLQDLGPELRELKKQGFVTQDRPFSGNWRVRPQAFLWWLADELVRTVRDETPFDEWLQAQEMGLVLTQSEKERLGQAVHAVTGLLKDGAATLIETVAAGLGAAAVRGL